MSLPATYENIIYPSNIDYFREVSNGNTPDSIIDAKLVNKVSKAVMAIESHMQYTADTPTTTGYYLLVDKRQIQLQADLPDPGLLFSVNFSVVSNLATTQFSGSPFNRNNAIFVSGVGYRIVNGQRSYYPTRAAVNTGAELGNLNLTINCIKTTKWLAGDICEVNLMIVRLPV